ncbi:TonB-dependent receptor [Chitinophaga ginsengisoli]|uniref:Iron complex outermembrane receptor protein n=1 Tax=Chitinophaga ginsengisoli TaxID=363837 RepID=A0A2P8FUF6_9BACT|nr:TonB-dependent receptor [Chitinophaga ginsengisoli]PSL25356.1 iron complex outermembrane receptor protein [Chitinophaga ginsengisoli]
MHTKFNQLFKFLCVLCVLFAGTPAYSINEPLAAIKGTVVTGDGQPAVFVPVQIKEKNRGTLTNEKGEFLFKRMHAGHYTLQVMLIGYKVVTKEVDVAQDQILNVTIQLEASNQQLQEVIINSARNKYKVDAVSGSLRLKTPLLEIPQNIQVISASLLADQQTYDIVDGITRNVSGVTRVGHWDNQYAQIRMRGSKIPAFRNGMNIEASWGPTAEDAAMIERIEFVKGPAGFMLANGEPGGFYNVVTKKPSGVTKGSANISMGSFSTYRAALDFDGKLSKDGKLLYRLNVAGQQKDFYTKYNYSNRYLFAPVLKYLVDDRTSITLEYTFQGSKYLNNGNYQFSKKKLLDEGISNDFFYGDPSLEPGKLRDHSAYVYLDHQLNDKWQAHAQVAYFNFSMVANSVWATSVAENGNMVRYFSIGDEAGENRFAQMSLSGEEYTGSIRHRILAGVDMGNKKFWGDFRTLTPSLNLAGGKVFNVYNPEYGIPFDSIPTIDRSKSVRTRAGQSSYISSVNYTSVYAQDELGFFDNKLRLSLALRFTHAETTGKTKTADMKDDIVTPRVGLSYSIDKSTAVYALYDQSFVPQTGLDSNLVPFKPVKGNDIEAGIKKDWLNGRWSTAISAYRIARQNAKVALGIKDSRGADVSVALGETVTKGIEADINGEIVSGLNVNINYAYTDSKITKEAPNTEAGKTTVGNITPNTAAHITNAWLSYRIGHGAFTGFGASAGIQWQAERAVGTTKVSNIPNYFRTDAGLNYSRGKYSVSFLVNNLLDDRKLLTAASLPANASGYYSYIVEARRNFRMSISYRF